MAHLSDFTDALAVPDIFDPSAFVGGDDVPQEVCNLVLALALVHNDYKDLMIAYSILESVRPSQPELLTADRGEYSGIETHMIRLHASLVNQLCGLIADSGMAIAHPSFSRLLKQLDGRARGCWQSLTAASAATPKNDPLAKALVLLRNKTSSHYDSAEIFRGYRHTFLERSNRPYISRGKTLRNTRFYFADAAAAGYLPSRMGDEGVKDFFSGTLKLLDSLNIALAQIVERFIQLRGVAWQRA